MKTPSVLWFCVAALMTLVLSCTDQGDIVNNLQVVEVSPAPNSARVDKAAVVSIQFDREVSVNEAGKILLRYVDGTDAVNTLWRGGLIFPVSRGLSVGPFIWKPGRTVEVTIPKEITDPDGNTLKQSIVYRFTLARDSVPFDLVETLPAQNDTVLLGGPSSFVTGNLVFNDYAFVRDSTLTIDPPADIQMITIAISDGHLGPQRWAPFAIRDLQPNTSYTITVPRSITDYEGEALPRDYRVVFHTRP